MLVGEEAYKKIDSSLVNLKYSHEMIQMQPISLKSDGPQGF